MGRRNKMPNKFFRCNPTARKSTESSNNYRKERRRHDEVARKSAPPLIEKKSKRISKRKKLGIAVKEEVDIYCELSFANVENDGNSLYRAIAHQLERSEKDYKTVKEEIRKELKNNLSCYTEELKEHGIKNVKKYLQDLGEDGTHGGEFEAFFASKSYDVKIIIHSKYGPRLVGHHDGETIKGDQILHIFEKEKEKVYDSIEFGKDLPQEEWEQESKRFSEKYWFQIWESPDVVNESEKNNVSSDEESESEGEEEEEEKEESEELEEEEEEEPEEEQQQ